MPEIIRYVLIGSGKQSELLDIENYETCSKLFKKLNQKFSKYKVDRSTWYMVPYVGNAVEISSTSTNLNMVSNCMYIVGILNSTMNAGYYHQYINTIALMADFRKE